MGSSLFSRLKSLIEYVRVVVFDTLMLIHGLRDRDSLGATEYHLRRNIHRIEKALRNPNCRIPFALEYSKATQKAFAASERFLPHEIKFWGSCVLSEYASRHSLTDFATQFDDPAPSLASASATLEAPNERYARLHEIVEGRDSCRHFIGPAPAPADLERVLQDMRNIPSSCNREAYRSLVIHDTAKRDWILANSIGLTNFTGVEHCSLVAFVVDLSAINHPRDRYVPVMDSSFSSLLFALALETLGLSSCYLNWPIRPSIDRTARELLGLHAYEKIIFSIVVGRKNPRVISGKSAKSGRVERV